MKIVSCHIENFGKLHEIDIDFAKGVNRICQGNGWGKSTFASFITAMFYGLDERGGRKKEERKKYCPWQGGVYGGRLVFAVGDRRYAVTRIFGGKETEDVFELRDAATNLVCTDYSARLGEELFGIDKTSFARTALIAQGCCETAVTDDISAKAGNLADYTDDLNNYDTAVETLKKIMNALNPNRATGSVSRRKEKIAQLERIVLEGERLASAMDEEQAHIERENKAYEQLKEELRITNEEQKKASRLYAASARKAEWERLQKRVQESRKQLDAQAAAFPDGIPDSAALEEQIRRCGVFERAQERADTYRLTDGEQKELFALADRFRDKTPKQEEVETKLTKAKRLQFLLQKSASNRLTDEEKDRFEQLKKFFANETQDVFTIAKEWELRNGKNAAMLSEQAALSSLKASAAVRKQKKTAGTVLAAAGVLLAAAGVFSAVVLSGTFGALIAAGGVTMFVLGVVMRQRASKDKETALEIAKTERSAAQKKARIRETDEAVASYLRSFGREFTEETVFSDLQEIAGKYQEYVLLRRKEQEAGEEENRKETAKITAELEAFLQPYQNCADETEFTDALYRLEADRKRFQTLCDRKKDYEEAVSDQKTAQEEICAFLKRYAYPPQENLRNQITQIRDAENAYRLQEKFVRQAQEELAALEAETDPSVFSLALPDGLLTPEETEVKIAEITEDMETVHRSMTNDRQRLEKLKERFLEREEIKRELEELKELQEEERQKYRRVQIAREYLGKAKEAMTARYADPIMKRFRLYYEMLTQSAADSYYMDANIALTVEEGGKQREITSLSAGYRDLIGICLRIAFIDVMYDEELPTVIMDDPFTNLDDQKQTAAGNFLRQLEKRYQIIYFTCSETRK